MWKFASDTGNFMSVKSDLDNDWHRLIDDETFYKYGHIYYGQRRDKTENKL